MKATLYSPSGAQEFDSHYGVQFPYDIGGEPPVITDPIDTDTDDTGSDYSTTEPLRATLDRYVGPGGGKFYWYTHDGEVLEPQDMATPHIFYALRMVWNHSVPRVWRVGNYKEYADVPRWSGSYRKAAITELANELAQRDDDLNEDQRQQLFEMVLKTIYILELGI